MNDATTRLLRPGATCGDTLHLGTFAGQLKARVSDDGHILWEHRLNGRLRFLPQLLDGVRLRGQQPRRAHSLRCC
jgi:hypothetical protein